MTLYRDISFDQQKWYKGRRLNNPRLRLICLPFAARSGNLFAGWQEGMPEGVEILAVHLPGRSDRVSERPIDNMRDMLSALDQVFEAELRQPYVLYGHCSGALTAYAWACCRRASGQRLPEQLFLASLPAPSPEIFAGRQLVRDMLSAAGVFPIPRIYEIESQQRTASVTQAVIESRRMLQEHKAAGQTPDQITDLATYDSKVQQQMVLLRLADYRVLETFDFNYKQKLPVPITALYGVADRSCSRPEVDAWRLLTSTRFELKEFGGGHMFIESEQDRDAVIEFIASCVARVCD